MGLAKKELENISQAPLWSLLESSGELAVHSAEFAEIANTGSVSKDAAAVIIQLNNLIQLITVQNIIIARGINASQD